MLSRRRPSSGRWRILRGCKPCSSESNQPWVELQLQAWNQPDDATWDRVLFKSVASFGWWLMLARVLAYACSDYYRVEAEREVLRIPAPVVRRAKYLFVVHAQYYLISQDSYKS